MIRIGRREYVISPWFEAVVPLMFGLYAALRVASSRYFDFGIPASDFGYVYDVTQIASGAIAGFFLIDLARRSVNTWYAFAMLAFFSLIVSAVAIDTFRRFSSFSALMSFKAAIGAAVTPNHAAIGFLPMSMFVGPILFLLLMAIGIALLLTLGGRMVAGLPMSRLDTLRDCGANMAGALIWVTLGLSAFFAIRTIVAGFPPGFANWIALVIALAVAITAARVHLLIVRRVRTGANAVRGSLRTWAAVLVCLGILFYSPYTYGIPGVRLLYDYVRPALRAVHVLPTPSLSVAGYTVSVPFHDLNTTVSREMPDGSPSQVSVPLPGQYGLAGLPSRVNIRRRDVPPPTPSSLLYGAVDLSKELKAVQDKAPDRDAVLLMSTTRYTELAMRLVDYPDVDVILRDFDRSTTRENAEQALRRFLHYCVRRTQ
jgi:hypothetical protein